VINIDREAFKHVLLSVQEPISLARITLRNAGNSPAELIEIIATSWKFDCFPFGPDPEWKTLIHDLPRDISIPVIGINRDIEPALTVRIHWTEDDIELVNTGNKRVGIYGMVRYCGGPKESYYTRFFWWFSPIVQPELQKAGSPELNERT
jgi:hypothetical protein